MPDLRELRVFVTVAEQASFTRAAEQLGLTQQTVSRAIARAEEKLGVELLQRTTREVHLTPAGATLLEAGRPLLEAAEAAYTRTQLVGRGLGGSVAIGVTPAIGPHDRTDVARVLRRGAPDLSVELREVRPREIVPMLRAGALDLVLSRGSGRGEGLHSAPLRPTPMILCLPADHPLARAPGEAAEGADGDPDPIPLIALHGERLMTWSPPGTSYTDALLSAFADAGATMTPVETRVTGGGAALAELSEMGAVALMPAGTVPPPGVVVREPAPPIAVPLTLLWSAARPSPAASTLTMRMGTSGG
ncbi:LysR family transcriptional regulator [Conexibacter sp. CPCC 206217]|uniref:LysR substrate-binding domain-containing protein n=1 Tax=Conexibacter sp. CPCC 206217 TaxID=3064574 RepID=UPI002725599C|nr:LysR family transcriptional regulator [Conexibacter sp. CPCC 206217]MDO8210254.1 LysR family transcriptional regulator [Conexibacter sp. CPCC 206217]